MSPRGASIQQLDSAGTSSANASKGSQQNSRKTRRELRIHIGQSFGVVDHHPTPETPFADQLYRAFLWVDPRAQFSTRFSACKANPAWNEIISIPVDPTDEHLDLEIVKYLSWEDPGSSGGVRSVGRSVVSFPTVTDAWVRNSAMLVKLAGGKYVEAGRLHFAMMLEGGSRRRGM